MNKFTKLSLSLCLSATVLFSACQKEYESIQTTDNATIAAFISKNNLTSVMVPDKDKTGFYYQVTSPGTGTAFKNTDSVFYNLTVKSLASGSTYLQSPLIANLSNFVGYTSTFYNSSLVSTTNSGTYSIPAINAAMLALKPGGTARILLPSYLAFGRNGAGNIPSNEVIDLLITTYPYQKQALLDDNRITTYLASKGLIATKDPSGIYYIVNTVGGGSAFDDIELSTAVVNYTGRFLDGAVFDSTTDGTFSSSYGSTAGLIQGWKTLIPKFKAGTKLRMFVPSSYAYGIGGSSSGVVPPNAVLDFDIEIVSVTN